MIKDSKKLSKTCDLQSCFLCRRCLDEWIPVIGAHRKNFHFKKGQVIFKEGDPVLGMYFVYSGVVKVHKQWGQEKELIIRFAAAGDIFGHRGLGGNQGEPLYPISATAIEPVTACFIDLSFFRTTLRVNERFTEQLLYFYASELQESERKMRDMAHMPVKSRVARALLTLQEKFGSTDEGYLRFTLSKQDLASYTGAAYETVFRIVNEMAKDELVSLSGKDIRILQPALLKKLTSETGD
jgi:CRP-like cAMP-binding protein